jgi:type II secretory pathway component GspD/PulD (secretin)
MNSKHIIILLIGLLASSFAGKAQDKPAVDAAADPAAGAPAVVTPADAAPPAEAAAPGVSTPAGSSQPGAIIPIIVMDEAKLTDAIRNLARMAGMNYLLDPATGFNQIGPDGKVKPEPTVSIRWENVTAEQALQALLNNYQLQSVEDPKSRIVRITNKDPLAPPPLTTKVIQLKYASPTNILIAVQNTLTDKRAKVVADVRTSQLVVLATEVEQADVDLLVERLDTATKQVLIEARLLEMSMNPTTKKGIDWSGTLENQNFSWGNGVMSGQSTTTIPGDTTSTTLPGGRVITTSPSHSTSTTLDSVIGNGGLGFNTARGLSPAIGFLNADGVKAVLSFINKEADAKTISTPRTVTLDNEEAKIEVTRANPIINVSAGTANTSGGSSIQYTNLGVILKVTPRISANNYVNLKIIPEVSRVFETQHRTVGSSLNGVPQTFDVDVYDIRKLETHVMIPSGNTLVLGGLIQDDVRNQNTKVPVLGDLPIIGYAFRSEGKSRQKGNLLIFITPTIVQDEDFQPTTSDFLKTPMPVGDYAAPDWSAWDTAKPLDWTKPAYPAEPKHKSNPFVE